jgi:hypothetical protein
MQHHTLSRPASSRPVAIEVDGEPVGVVVPADEGYRFLAVRLAAFGSDGKTFPSIDAARASVAREIMATRPDVPG